MRDFEYLAACLTGFAGIGFLFAFGVNANRHGLIVAGIIGYIVGVIIYTIYNTGKLDGDIVFFFGWVTSWTGGGIAAGNLAIGWPAWATGLFAAGLAIASALLALWWTYRDGSSSYDRFVGRYDSSAALAQRTSR